MNPGNGKDCMFNNGKMSEGRPEYERVIFWDDFDGM